jgi:threonylcarbamoyladenosine tRNA methylthiotransferase MtaB
MKLRPIPCNLFYSFDKKQGNKIPMKERPKVSFNTLGCRLNLSETAQIADQFIAQGYEVVPFESTADVVFVNTCTVTDGADSSCRNLIRKAKKYSPESKLVVAGCYAQMEADKIKEMPVDFILGNNEKFKVLDLLSEDKETQVAQTHINLTKEFHGAMTSGPQAGRTRGFLKVQDGCNYICSFCIIPAARGRSRTITVEVALESAKNMVQLGHREIVLTGVNIGEYGQSSGVPFEELVEKILAIKGIERFRLSSIEPNTITRRLLGVLSKHGSFMPHFHVPMQSGSDPILTSMRRKYTRQEYKEKMAMVREFFPQAALGGDIMVGYPGETQEHFEDTLNLVRECGMTHLHVFPFSVRKGTIAQRLPFAVDKKVKQERVKRLIQLGQDQLTDSANKKIGSVSEVLFEHRQKGKWRGYTPDFYPVELSSKINVKNEIKKCFLKAWNGQAFEVDLV